jgi:uncharacterized Fe-S radical SAM superfamily protein PflX
LEQKTFRTCFVPWATGRVCEKISQNVAQPIFCQNYYIRLCSNFCKKLPKILATSVILELPRENGRKSPNLVTLFVPELVIVVQITEKYKNTITLGIV